MQDLTRLLKNFSALSRAPGAVWTEATKHKAPHKPLLLLAVLDLVHRGVISSPFIDVCGDLTDLNELFNLYWRRIIPLGQTSSIAFPFSRLHREPFWELVPQPGKIISSAEIGYTSSVSYLNKYALGAKLGDGLFQLIQTGEGREALREALLLSCFSAEAAAQLREQSVINREAFNYSRILEEQAHLPLVKEIVEAENYRADVRDQAFRKVVTKAYDHSLYAASASSPLTATRWWRLLTSCRGTNRRTTTSGTEWPYAEPVTGVSTRACSASPKTTQLLPPAPSV